MSCDRNSWLCWIAPKAPLGCEVTTGRFQQIVGVSSSEVETREVCLGIDLLLKESDK